MTTSPTTYRVRLRFRVEKRLKIAASQVPLIVSGHDAVLSADVDGTNIDQADWLVLNVRGLVSEDAAKTFGALLKLAVDAASVGARQGVDTGISAATSGVSIAVKTLMQEQRDIILRDNVHGLDVFIDDKRVRIFRMQAAGHILKDPSPFLDDINVLIAEVGAATQPTIDMILLLNHALMRKDPVAQIVFAFSAVEMIGQAKKWSPAQVALLTHLASVASNSAFGTQEERDAISEALTKSIHPKGLRQGVLELMQSLSLGHLKKDWDLLYGQRSTLVHGLAPRPGVDYGELAFKVVSLCGLILLTAIAKEVPSVAAHIEKFYIPEAVSFRYVETPFKPDQIV
jgi:hypothetical protein